jgi:pimeloyl-ACP methyl ester carboxylesterase
MNGALDQLKASPNPMTLDGRMALCQGALAHRDLRELLPKLQLPVVVVQGSQNLLVRPEHAQPYVSALCDGARASTLRELAERGHGVSVVRVNAGHLLLHETPALLVRLLTAAIDESWAAVDSELLTHLAPPTPPAPTADSATW